MILLTVKTFSQQTAGERNEQVTIVGSYDPTINPAFKINMKPEMITIEQQKPDFTYQVMNVPQDTKIDAGKVSPATIRADKKISIYDNYLKAGFGSLMTPYIDFFHSSGSKNDSRFNARLYHLSSFKDIPDYAPSSFANTDLGINYDKYSGNSIFSFGLGYGLDMYRYYGFQPAEFPDINTSAGSLKQSFNQIRANIGIRSNNKKEEAPQYAVNLAAYYYFDRWKTSQTDFNLGYDIAKPFKSNKSGFQKLGIKGLFRFGVNKDSLQSNTDILLTAIPYYAAKFGMVSFSLGVNVSYLVADSSSFGIFPVIDVSVNLLPDALTIYAGTDGGFVKNSFFDLSQENPWVSSTIPITWQKNQIRAFAGVRGNVAGQLGFNLELGWLKFENMPFFISHTDDVYWPVTAPALQFDALTDNGSVFSVNGELTYMPISDLNIWLSGRYDAYSLDSLPEPYHKPLTLISLGGSYIIKEKVKLWLEMFSYGKRHAVDMTGDLPTEVELDGFLDLNAGVEYYATERLTVFVKGTNLLNKNYQRFLNYPVQGLQVMGGIGFRF